MRTAIYIEDGTVQLVITPETDFEKDAMKSFCAPKIEAQIMRGSFYACQGGWIRKRGFEDAYEHDSMGLLKEDNSLIIRVDNRK